MRALQPRLLEGEEGESRVRGELPESGVVLAHSNDPRVDHGKAIIHFVGWLQREEINPLPDLVDRDKGGQVQPQNAGVGRSDCECRAPFQRLRRHAYEFLHVSGNKERGCEKAAVGRKQRHARVVGVRTKAHVLVGRGRQERPVGQIAFVMEATLRRESVSPADEDACRAGHALHHTNEVSAELVALHEFALVAPVRAGAELHAVQVGQVQTECEQMVNGSHNKFPADQR